MLHYTPILSRVEMIAMFRKLFGKSSAVPKGASQKVAVPRSAAPMPAAPMPAPPMPLARKPVEQKTPIVTSVAGEERAKEAEKYYSYFLTEKTLLLMEKSYVAALYCIIKISIEVFAPCQKSFDDLTEIEGQVDEVREKLDVVKEKLDALEQAEAKLPEQESLVPLNRMLRLIATQDWPRLKAHMTEREVKNINTENLPPSDFTNIPEYLVAGIHVALARKPKDNPEADECFQLAVEAHNSRFKTMSEAVIKHRKLLVDLPRQKDDYESCRARLYSIQAKINKRLEARAAKDLAAQGKFAVASGAAKVEAQSAASPSSRHEAHSRGPG